MMEESPASVIFPSPQSQHGMSTLVTGLFLAGEMAGSGILALPYAIVQIGWVGFPLLLMCCCGAAYSAVQLGKCWNILERQWPEEFTSHVRYPYPCIALKAAGFKMRVAVSICIQLTLFGAGVVVLIQCSDFLVALIHHSGWGVCRLLPIIAAAVLPILFLGTPKDFWPVGIAALLSTTVACGLIVVQLLLSSTDDDEQENTSESDISFRAFSTSFATILFSFGGASTFPTIQNDMQRKEKFHVSVGICFPQEENGRILFFYAVLLALYLPVVLAAYCILGDQRTSDNIILSLRPGPLRTGASLLVSLHLFATCVIVLNPLCQELEEYLRIPSRFTWKRCAFRSGILTLAVLVGEAIPKFGAILNLIGGSTITLCTLVFPSVFYVLLAKKCNKLAGRTIYEIQPHPAAAMAEIVIVGILGGAAATYTALGSLAGAASFTPPCFANFSEAV